MRSLVTTKYGLPWQQALKACMGREWRLFYRNSFAFYSSTFQVGFLPFANVSVYKLLQNTPKDVLPCLHLYRSILQITAILHCCSSAACQSYLPVSMYAHHESCSHPSQYQSALQTVHILLCLQYAYLLLTASVLSHSPHMLHHITQVAPAKWCPHLLASVHCFLNSTMVC